MSLSVQSDISPDPDVTFQLLSTALRDSRKLLIVSYQVRRALDAVSLQLQVKGKRLIQMSDSAQASEWGSECQIILVLWPESEIVPLGYQGKCLGPPSWARTWLARPSGSKDLSGFKPASLTCFWAIAAPQQGQGPCVIHMACNGHCDLRSQQYH